MDAKGLLKEAMSALREIDIIAADRVRTVRWRIMGDNGGCSDGIGMVAVYGNDCNCDGDCQFISVRTQGGNVIYLARHHCTETPTGIIAFVNGVPKPELLAVPLKRYLRAMAQLNPNAKAVANGVIVAIHGVVAERKDQGLVVQAAGYQFLQSWAQMMLLRRELSAYTEVKNYATAN